MTHDDKHVLTKECACTSEWEGNGLGHLPHALFFAKLPWKIKCKAQWSFKIKRHIVSEFTGSFLPLDIFSSSV